MSNEETLYARYLSGEITKEEEELLKSNGDWKKLEKLIAMADSLTLPDIKDKSYVDQIVQQKDNKGTVKKLPFLKVIQSIAAALLVASSLYLFFQNSKEPTTLSTTNATITAHTFADNSEVYLNADTDVSYNDNNWNKSRKINLDGEAYFEVNKGNDFIVSTSEGSIRVLGTKFNVKQRANTLHVSCYEGSVAVTSNDTEKILVAGQGVSFYNSGTISEYKISTDQPDWRQGRSIFREENIQEVFDELERQFNIKVTANSITGTFSGSFSNNVLERAVKEIAAPLNLSTQISEDQNTVTFSNK